MDKILALVLVVVGTLTLIAFVVFGDMLPSIQAKSAEVKTQITGTNIESP